MKPFAVITSLNLTYRNDIANDIFGEMLEPVYRHRSVEERQDLLRFLHDGFSFVNVMKWQPHKDWYVDDVKQFLNLLDNDFKELKDRVFGYAMVEDFFKELANYTAEMLKEPPKKDDWPFWFLSMYLRPAMNS